jgi:hypothetical protein
MEWGAHKVGERGPLLLLDDDSLLRLPARSWQILSLLIYLMNQNQAQTGTLIRSASSSSSSSAAYDPLLLLDDDSLLRLPARSWQIHRIRSGTLLYSLARVIQQQQRPSLSYFVRSPFHLSRTQPP